MPASGTANTDSNVAVKGQSAGASRTGRYWSDQVVVNNAVRQWWGALAIFTAKPGGGGGGSDLNRSDTRNAWLAAALQSFTYDHDGNLTGDGVWDYSYDAENRLVSMQTTTNAANYGFPNRVLQFKYDYAGRRVQKRVLDAGTSAEISSRRFVYDGWNLVAEYEAPSGTSLGSLVRSYTWGLDIVHSLARSGGVGALLQIQDHASGKTFLPTYDGNGNIAALLNASTGGTAVCYEYSPYGEIVRSVVSDSTVAEQPFRFSTKFTDVETGLVYYGHRYYDTRLGRFINRDPIEESGGLNLYGFCGNNGINQWDYLGCEPNVTNHQSVTADGTSFTSFFVTVTDSSGNVGQWNFSSREDADRWGQAWEDGDRALTDPYLVARKNDDDVVTNPGTDESNENDLDEDDGYGILAPTLTINGNTVGRISNDTAMALGSVARDLNRPTQPAATNSAVPAGRVIVGDPVVATTATTGAVPSVSGGSLATAAATLLRTAGAFVANLVSSALTTAGSVIVVGAGILLPQNSGSNGNGSDLSGRYTSTTFGVRVNTPATGLPGSVVTFPDGTTRIYGPDGNAVLDVDTHPDHNGSGVPHFHPWDWSNPTQPRRPGEPMIPNPPATPTGPANPPTP